MALCIFHSSILLCLPYCLLKWFAVFLKDKCPGSFLLKKKITLKAKYNLQLNMSRLEENKNSLANLKKVMEGE